MKFCSHCGAELRDEAIVCPKCGCGVSVSVEEPKKSTGLQTAVKVFMVLGCVVNAGLGFIIYGLFSLITLCWTLPMTIHYFKAVNSGKSVGVGFKVCSLLFVSLIAGILMLCDNNQPTGR